MNNLIKENTLYDAKQIFDCNKKLEEYSILNKGNKEIQTELITAEERKSDSTIESLYDLLKIERVFLTNKRSRGVYEFDKNRVKIITTVGKLSNFGYVENNEIYLKPHEALLLLEMNRLEVTFDTVVMSVEQGYSIFLNSKCELSLEEYIVYSYISRIGYIILTHDAEYDREKFMMLEEKKKVNRENEMIWCVLLERLNLPHSRDLIDSDYDLYTQTKISMDKSAEAISGKRDECVGEIFNESNVSQNEPPQKKIKIDISEHDNNFLDILKTELEYLTYRQIFEKFSYISRKNFDESDFQNTRKLKFTFDLFLPKANFKRTEHLANYRVIVIRSNDKFPTNIELQNLRMKQSYEVPIIIAVVSESMTAHFSICTF